MAAASKKRKEATRLIEQARKMLEGLETHGHLLPAELDLGGQRMTVAEIKSTLTTHIQTMVSQQEAIDAAEEGLQQAVEARSAGLRKLRGQVGEEVLAQLGFGDPSGAAKGVARRVRGGQKKKKR